MASESSSLGWRLNQVSYMLCIEEEYVTLASKENGYQWSIIEAQGSRDGIVVRAGTHLPLIWPAWIQFQPGVICGFSLLWVSSHLAVRGFSPGTPFVLPPEKPCFFQVQFNLLDRGPSWKPVWADVALSLSIVILVKAGRGRGGGFCDRYASHTGEVEILLVIFNYRTWH